MADHIKDEEDVLNYLNDAFKENDPELLLYVIGCIARSDGMSALAKKAGVARESLYRSLSRDGNPSFITIVKIFDILGFEINVQRKTA
jgi:probable addiction module antidote protein